MTDVNEEKLAEIFSEYLDAFLAGEPAVQPVPDEVAQFLTMAESLTDLTPNPRPEFGPALRKSLFDTRTGGGANGSSGGPFAGSTWLVIGSIVVLAIALSLLAGGIIVGLNRSDRVEGVSPPVVTPMQTNPLPAEAGPPTTAPELTPAQMPEPAATNRAVDGAPSTPPTLTPVLDLLPPITATVEAGEELPAPPDIVPGSSGSGGGSGGGSSGDKDRGHGNDSDRNDEDNPGRGRNDDD